MAIISLHCPSEQPVDISGAIDLLGNPHKVRPKDGEDGTVLFLWYFSSGSSAEKAMASLQDKLPGAEIEVFYRRA